MRATKIRKSLNYLDMKTNPTSKPLKGNIVLHKVSTFAKKRNMLNRMARTVANESEKHSSLSLYKTMHQRDHLNGLMHLRRRLGVSFLECLILIVPKHYALYIGHDI